LGRVRIHARLKIQMFIPHVAKTAVVKCLSLSGHFDGKRLGDLPWDGAKTRDENDEEPSFPNNMRHASIAQILAFQLLGSRSEAVFESVEVAELGTVRDCYGPERSMLTSPRNVPEKGVRAIARCTVKQAHSPAAVIPKPTQRPQIAPMRIVTICTPCQKGDIDGKNRPGSLRDQREGETR
jgi:hypothetical protein